MQPHDHEGIARTTGALRAQLGDRLMRDEAGLSSIEYAVLFVIIIIGSIALWGEVGESLAGEMGKGRETLNEHLGHQVERGAGGGELGSGAGSIGGGGELGSGGGSPPSGGGQPPEQGTTEPPRVKRKLRTSPN